MNHGRFIGLMSGTSLDGIDAALTNISQHSVDLVHAINIPFQPSFSARLQRLIDAKTVSWNDIGEIDNQLAQLFAEATHTLLAETHTHQSEVIAIGCHGQTVHHAPDADWPFTLQWGNPAVLALMTQIPVVSNFRELDVALGGQGAPLAPAFHKHAFSSEHENRVVVNIGGISNITTLPATHHEPIIGFDTGPGNGLMNAWIQQHLGQSYDHGGQWARSGALQIGLLNKLMEDNYFRQKPPKSSGREYFNLRWLASKCPEIASLHAEDVQNTLCALTSRTIADQIKALTFHESTPPEVIICGGGAHNDFLMEQLRDELAPLRVRSSSSYGIEPDWVEALAFAWLAWAHLNNTPGNITTVTGASQPAVLGRFQKTIAPNP